MEALGSGPGSDRAGVHWSNAMDIALLEVLPCVSARRPKLVNKRTALWRLYVTRNCFFCNARNERLVEACLKAFLLALGRLALAARMECARVEIEHG